MAEEKKLSEKLGKIAKELEALTVVEMAELSKYLEERNIKVTYLHSEILTLDRTDILDDLRLGKFDVLVGINLLYLVPLFFII